MSGDWTQYFECKTEKNYWTSYEWYVYKDKNVTTLPADLPMPPTDTFYYMFYKCEQLQDISALANWNVSNVKDMRYMFHDCHQLKDITSLANWDVSDVKDMSCLFENCYLLQDISALANWDVSNVKIMSCMFCRCHQLKDITALSSWDISNVRNITYMFAGCMQLKDVIPLANWNISNVNYMDYMFTDCRELQDITALSSWDISNVKDMMCMFSDYNRFNIREDECEYDSADDTMSTSEDTDGVKSYLRNLPKCSYPKQDNTQLLQSLWERVKPLLKYTTPLNGYFKRYVTVDIPYDWQSIEIPQWNP